MPIPLSSILSASSSIVPVLFGLYYLRRLGPDMILLLVFLSISVLVEAVIGYLAFLRVNNLWLINLYFLVDYSMLISVLAYWQQNGVLKKVFRWSIPVYILLWLITQRLLDSMYQMNHVVRSVECILLATAALYTLYRLSLETDSPLYDDFRFWVSSSILIYFSGSLVLYSLGFLMATQVMRTAWVIHSVLNITSNLCFAGGFLCLGRQKATGG